MSRRGFTLLELMVSITVLVMVLGFLYGLAFSLAQGAAFQEAKVTTVDETRTAMQFLVRQVHQSASGSITWYMLPGPQLDYRIALDVDGNGTAVNIGGDLELSAPRWLGRDVNDLNGDGLTLTQLVMADNTRVMRVVANGLLIDEDLNGNGSLDAGEDFNRNNVLDRGLWFERVGSGVRITVQTQRMADVRGLEAHSTLVETVVPRN
jgi:prepilin-type N-terminal cleavage/methylation domain-containing protein